MDAKNDVKFRTIKDACNCFGYNYKGCQSGYVKHPFEKNTHLWFPLLNPDGEGAWAGSQSVGWDNRISEDETTITTEPIDEALNERLIQDIKDMNPDSLPKRIAFVKVKDNLGFTFYRFRGVYTVSIEESLKKNVETWRRKSTWVKTENRTL